MWVSIQSGDRKLIIIIQFNIVSPGKYIKIAFCIIVK
jgi:hypothetical protein